MEYGLKPNGELDRLWPWLSRCCKYLIAADGAWHTVGAPGQEGAGSLQESPRGVTAETQSSTRGRCSVELPG